MTRVLLLHSAQRKCSNTLKIRTPHPAGFTLVEIMIGVAIIGLLAAIAIPNFVRARNTAQKNACINNLRQIDGAKQQWALENKKADADTPGSTDVAPYIKNNLFPTCPSSGTYTIGAVNTDPTCSQSYCDGVQRACARYSRRCITSWRPMRPVLMIVR